MKIATLPIERLVANSCIVGVSLLLCVAQFGCGHASPAAPPVPAAISADSAKDASVSVEPKVVPRPKIGLVLGGGGARGFAHIGVLRVLEGEKIPIDLVVGTSVGSLIGALYAAEPNSFELEWKAMEITKDDFLDYSLFAATTGPVKGDAIRAFVRKTVAKTRIEDFPVPFVAIATDLNTGKREEFTKGSVEDAVRASASIPGVFTPAHIDNRTFIDGGVVANLAVDVARAHGADIVIAANITEQVTDYNVTDVVSIIMQAINIMMGEMADGQLKNADVVIAPSIGDVSTLDFTQKKRCVKAGIEARRPAITRVRAAILRYYRERGGVPPPELVGPVAQY